jgi:tartrate dehydrogenase/decarboxylase / D-malate dehydrogenase
MTVQFLEQCFTTQCVKPGRIPSTRREVFAGCATGSLDEAADGLSDLTINNGLPRRGRVTFYSFEMQTTSKTFRVAAIPGDGIGREVLPDAIRVLEAAARIFDFRLEWEFFDWSCEYYARFGRMMPENGLSILRPFDAIFLGAVGYPGVADHVSLWGLLIPIRRGFQQYVNLRPAKLCAGVASPLAARPARQIDFVVVRENTEGEYSEVGGRYNAGTSEEYVVQESKFTRVGCDRILRYAFELARKRRRHVTSATKSNGIVYSMPYWDERFAAIAKEFPDVATDQFHVDILCSHFVTKPESFDVVVASNLFGDILSDLAAGVVGSIGLAPGANINPEREFPSMFEPVHGSAPDIAGKGIANPIAQIRTGAMMLDHLGARDAAAAIEAAVERVLSGDVAKTPDLGGSASTGEVTNAVIGEIGATAIR